MNLSELNKKNNSIWISASAGTGKTWSLTRRVISLVLQGTAPEKILGITFTNNASFEMKERITSTILDLLCLSEDEFISKILKDFELDIAPQYSEVIAKLFYIIDRPNALKIHTIHSFCLDLVKSYPFELGLKPGFSIMTSLAKQRLISQTLSQIIALFHKEANPLLEVISNKFKEQKLLDEIEKATKHSDKIKNHFLKSNLKLDLNKLKEKIHLLRMQFISIAEDLCKEVLLINEVKNNQFIINLLNWNILNDELKLINFSKLAELFLTKEGEMRKTLLNKDVRAAFEGLSHKITKVQELAFDLCKKTDQLENDFYSEAMLIFLARAVAIFDDLKSEMNIVDFDDIIKFANELLAKNEFSNWVLYKLDYKFDHLLIDEAQDTNHKQWTIINKISDEFFSGYSEQKLDRSLFIVGDKKQSIFGFQGSEPECFDYYLDYYKEKLKSATDKNFLELELKKSFRSASSIIDFVNHLFAKHFIPINPNENLHETHHLERPGIVELWPLYHGDEEQTAERKLALLIAKTIQEWLLRNRLLASSDKVITPHDIMILVRKRGSLYRNIIKALNEYNIPNSGEDRFELKEHLFIKDLIAAAQFALLPEDDLICAALLRSPFVAMDDQLLEDLCVNRTEALYKSCECGFLTSLISSRHMSPQAFFFNIILTHQEKYIPYYGINLKSLISQFIGLIDEFEKDHIPSLQLFIDWIMSNNFEIKKDQDFALSEVKIITTHSSKGLESKIIFFPDTTSSESDDEPLMEVDGQFYYSMEPGADEEQVTLQRQKLDAKQRAENLRLLYVGLTRPTNELYIMGATNRSNLHDNSWYSLIQKSMMELARPVGPKYRLGELDYKYASSNLHAAKIESKPREVALKNEQYISNIAPSKMKNFEAISPYDQRYLSLEMGQNIHNFMSIYPQLMQSSKLVGEIINNLYPKALLRINISLLKKFFEPIQESLIVSEASFIEMEDSPQGPGRNLFRGSIDMLTINDDLITIYEYKSNINQPDSMDALPQIYKNQMQKYCNIIARQFPSLKIKAKFFWLHTGTITDFAFDR